jgi:hypothetical protein
MRMSCDSRTCHLLSRRSDSCNTIISISYLVKSRRVSEGYQETYMEAGRVKFRPKKPLSIPVSVTYAYSPSGEKVNPDK